MDNQQNLNDLVDEMSSVLVTLQTDMIKVMNAISQLNIIITKIKQFKSNNINDNIMNNMMNINNNMQNMVMGMNNNMMGMQNMNMGMPSIGMMNNMNMGMQEFSIEEKFGWNLIFENQDDGKSFNVFISEQKLVKEAIGLYMLKSGRNDKCKFVFNNHELYPEMKICQSGLSNMSRILVFSSQNVRGG